MENDLKNKLFLVTGGSKGIGSAIVKKLYKSKARVAFTYNSNQVAAEELISSLNSNSSSDIKCYKLDVRNYDDIEKLITQIEDEMGEIYGLVNNAGITKDVEYAQELID